MAYKSTEQLIVVLFYNLFVILLTVLLFAQTENPWSFIPLVALVLYSWAAKEKSKEDNQRSE